VSGPVATTLQDREPPQSGAHLELVTLPGIEPMLTPLIPVIPEEDVRQQAEEVIRFVEP
jgi:hypothetical protein